MEAPGSNTDAYRGSSGTSNSRRYGMQLSASSIIQAPVSALLEYMRTRSSHPETEGLINGGFSAGFRDHFQSRLDESAGASEQEHDSNIAGQVREVTAHNEVSAQQLAQTASATAALDGLGDSRSDRVAGEGVSQPSNGSADGEAVDGAGVNNRDSSYQRYDIQQAARWIEQAECHQAHI
ncbi:hypothetical protein L1049_007906 [Liquidambar formosana]|uniref:Uncharacterized protein n=1 Tax=Liquidambar formosana TaxID=63359 RepID=A0AAP0X532_LIQFO